MEHRLSTISNETFFNTSKTSSSAEAFPLRHWELVWISCIAFLSVLANSIIIHVLWRSRSSLCLMSYNYNHWLASLATADLLLSLIALPNYVLSTSVFTHPSGKEGDLMCKIFTGYSIWPCLAQVSIYHVAGISTERLKVVINPSQAQVFKLTTKIKIAVAWIFPFLLYLPIYPTYITYSPDHPELGNYCGEPVNQHSTITYSVLSGLILIFGYILPLFVLVYCFLRIGKQLKLHEKALVDNMVVTDTDVRERLKTRTRRTLLTLWIVVSVFLICWTPAGVLYFSQLFGSSGLYRFNSEPYQAARLMGFSNSFINCLVYASLSEEFRKHFCLTFPAVACVLKSLFSMCRHKKMRERALLIKSDGRRNSHTDYDSVTMTIASTPEENAHHGDKEFAILRLVRQEVI